MKKILLLLAVLPFIACQGPDPEPVKVHGELKQWHKVTLDIRGPESSELGETNPFLDYRVEVTFSQGDKKFVVPAYFAADGKAAESSATSGDIWRVHFRPESTGTWHWEVSFKQGSCLAILDNDATGTALMPHGRSGSMDVAASDKEGKDFRARGFVINAGRGYARTSGDGKLWIKSGADSPENFLAYRDFDATYRFNMNPEPREGEANVDQGLHAYESHLADWQEGDPVWQDGKGKSIIGAVNYLHSKGINSIYMLTMNILGDGRDVWPYTDYSERARFDCSKLDQWAIVFDHMESLGMMNHFVLQETENEVLLDNGHTDVHRRVYLREMVARFGHLLAVTWNIGEENGPTDWSPVGQTEQMKKDMAAYIRKLDPWPNLLVLHTHSNDHHQDIYLEPFLGLELIDGPSMQITDPTRVHERMLHFVEASEKAGERWYVALDEIGRHWMGVMPDDDDPKHDTVRHHCLWGSLLAGGAGVEWYFGYRYAHSDLGLEDFRSRDLWWDQSVIATEFMARFPLEEMSSMDGLLKGTKDGYCLAKQGELYLLYLPIGAERASLDAKLDRELQLRWFDPRKGGELQRGSVTALSGKGPHSLGSPPAEAGLDWVAVIGN